MSIVKEPNERKELKRFGIILGFILLAIGLIQTLTGNSFSRYFLVSGAMIVFWGIYFQSVLRPVYKIWMKIGFVLGWITSRIILIILFYLIITPIGIIGRVFGKQFIITRPDRKRHSYWHKRETGTQSRESLEKQF